MLDKADKIGVVFWEPAVEAEVVLYEQQNSRWKQYSFIVVAFSSYETYGRLESLPILWRNLVLYKQTSMV